MPNIDLQFFYDQDVFNFTATRSQSGAPKIKPAWKVRTAPKLAPKEPKEIESSSKPTPRITDVTDSEPSKPKPAAKKIPKLAPKKSAVPSDTASVTSEAPQAAKAASKKNIPKLAPKKQ